MTSQSPPNPAPETFYADRVAHFEDEASAAQRIFDRLANYRLMVALVGILIAGAGYYSGAYTLWWGAVIVPFFIALMVRHERVSRVHRRATALRRFYEALGKRMNGGGPVRPATGEEHVDANHPCALDVDLIGDGSVFQRINLAQTAAGERALARRLTKTADGDAIAARQDAAVELAPRHDLLEGLELAGTAVRKEVRPDALARWVQAPAFQPPGWAIGASYVLPVVSGFALLVWVASGIALPFVVVFAISLVVLARFKGEFAALSAAVNEPDRELKVLAGALRVFEGQEFASPLLRALQERIVAGDVRASACIGRLDMLVDLYEAPRNAFFAPIAITLMWPLHTARLLEKWRATWGPRVTDWTEALGELEAALSLGAYAFECPEDVFPTLGAGPVFEAEGIAHPLLPRGVAVRNDVALRADRPMLMITGSNMSGKSTLLRTVGVATAMAMAGAPVRARSLTVSPMAIGSNIRVHDSIQEGKSRFYAEIVRLKELMAMAEADGPPLLFLLDELLHGTNSHDRRIGAEAVLVALLNTGALGMVTSHDLALADMVDRLGHTADNVHLEDAVEGDRLVFDYTLKPGVVAKSNALALMQAVGLPVGPATDSGQ